MKKVLCLLFGILLLIMLAACEQEDLEGEYTLPPYATATEDNNQTEETTDPTDNKPPIGVDGYYNQVVKP